MVYRVRLPQSIGRIGVRLWGPFVIGAVVSLAVVVIIAAISADVQRRDAATLQREIAQRVATGVDLYVRQIQDDVAALADTLPLIGSDLEVQRLQLKAATSKLDSPIYQLSIVGLDGTERVKAIQHRPRPTDFENLSGDPAFAAALAGRTYFGPVYNSEFGVPFVDMAVPIRDALGHTQSVLRAEIDLSTLWSLVNTASVGEEGYVYVIGADGMLLAYHDVPRLMTQASVGHLLQVQDALQNVALPVARAYATGLEGVPVLAYYLAVDIGPGQWGVIVEQPLSDAYAQADLFSLIGAGLSAVALVAILIMGLFIRQRIARPIEALRRGAAALGSGDLNHRIDIDTGDELEFLAHEFNQMSATLQQSQARLASLVRERERQAEDAQSRVREMSALIQSGRAITSLDLETVLGRLAREVAHAVRGDRCSIYVFDARQRRLTLRGEWEAGRAERERGVLPAGVNGPVAFEWGEGIVGLVAEQGKPLFLANAQADRRFVPKAPNDHDIAALIGVPLLSDANMVGVLQASTRPGTPPFDPSDQRLLGTFADQASAAIKNSFLYETERRRAQEMTVVAEITRTISASLDLDATLDSILSTVRRLISYDLAEITLWDAEHEVLRTRGRGADPRYADYSRTTGGVYRLDQGFSGWIA
ncbi:MAG TPA: cache domain-containing protein, partial [Anaerolineae bacterium]|nr:cache domain-containing protein [Anaerolineae bacterium]